jgi:Spy/CpxP family protein refolding chaperone
MSGRSRRTALLVLLAVFLAGGAAGWVLEEVVEEIQWPGHGADDESPDSEDDPMDDDAEEDFLEALGLGRAQLDSVDRLLDAREDRLEEYWRSRLPEMQQLIDSTRAGIRALLTPEQRAAYDTWTQRQAERGFTQ